MVLIINNRSKQLSKKEFNEMSILLWKYFIEYLVKDCATAKDITRGKNVCKEKLKEAQKIVDETTKQRNRIGFNAFLF